MEKVVWDTIIAPSLREQLIRKYVPNEPVDPLVYKVTAFYWLLQELVGNWKMGQRLTIDQKTQLLQLLVWNLSQIEPEPDIEEQVAQLVLACKDFHLKE
jgi:uncharacterized protein YeaC (DUF1315 family)